MAEGRAVRQHAGIIDLSSFGKIDVTGPGALALLQRIAANDLDKPVGAVVYTPWCDERGGMVADVTVMRLAADRFRVVTGAGFVASDRAWLRSHVDGEDVGDRGRQWRIRDDRPVGSAGTGHPCRRDRRRGG